jgi:nucleoside-diphosphate-sugar epimerase/uncharacterized membrane protein
MRKPLVIITGAAGEIGSALCKALRRDYFVAGLDLRPAKDADTGFTFDLTSPESVQQVLHQCTDGRTVPIAAVIHLAAYFDFSGDDSPAYQAVNIDGTRNLLEALQLHEVERFIYSSTMLVHAPTEPGGRINEDSPIGPRWKYPQSKAETEAVIRRHAGTMPFAILRLAGVYDDKTAVPTLAHQIARIFERTIQSRLYAGDPHAGQAFLHKDDMIDAFVRVVEQRNHLPPQLTLLVGEEDPQSYDELQDRLGELIHGADEWRTLRLPEPVAKAGAWVEDKIAPVVPEDFGIGREPFIKPFMIDLASDHYALDTRMARDLLGWRPRHALRAELEHIVQALKADPAHWYAANKIPLPYWLDPASALGEHPDVLRRRHDANYAQEHQRNLWAHFANVALGGWLVTSPAILGYESNAMAWSDIASGLALTAFSLVSLSKSHGWARFASALVGAWLLFAPLLFWVPSSAAYLNGTLVGMLAIGFAMVVRPMPGISPVATVAGPTAPPGWDHNPSDWFQRVPVITLAFLGFFLSRHMAAYQLGHIEAAWDPVFAGTRAGLSGTEDVLTSELSRAFPVPDAGMGAIVYALEILIGMMGAANRWRTMPWVVAAFGVLIVPLGFVSVLFIVIQPILIGTWCLPCLVAAGAMLLQAAYAANEFVAMGQFLWRCSRRGRPVLKIFFVGDTDEGESGVPRDDFRQSPFAVLKDSFTGGVGLPWNLALCILIGAWLMLTRVTLDHAGAFADWDHLVGALVITVTVISMAEVARPLRLLVVPLAIPLFFTPFIYEAEGISILASLACGTALIALCLRRGPIRGRYGEWNRLIV